MQKLSLLTRFEREKIVPIHDIELMKSPSIAIERGHLIANPPRLRGIRRCGTRSAVNRKSFIQGERIRISADLQT